MFESLLIHKLFYIFTCSKIQKLNNVSLNDLVSITVN